MIGFRSFVMLGFIASALMACQSHAPAFVNDPNLAQRCADQSGFTARIAAERASGATGRLDATPEELAAINACVGGDALQQKPQPAQSPVTAAPAQQLRDVAGVPQRIETTTNGTATTQTYTYGTPPAIAAPVVPASGAAPTRQCRLQMTGGTGYSCAIR
jgi:hypothetical protein